MKKTFTHIICSLFLLLSLSVSGQELVSYREAVNDGYNFWVYTPPNYNPSEGNKPVLLFFHGASLCGHDLNKVLRYGPVNAISRGRNIDAVIVVPQNPGGAWRPQKAMNVLNWVQKHYAVDTNRIYVLGMSLGGYGTIDFAATYPEKVAAAMALCGGGSGNEYCGLNDVPLWILHGTADRDVGIKESQKVINAMQRCGSSDRLIFTKLKGVNHSRPARAFYIDETYDWLFSHHLNDPGRPVNHDYTISPYTLSHAYSNLGNTKIQTVSGGNGSDKTILDATSTSCEQTSHTAIKEPHLNIEKEIASDTTVAVAKVSHTATAAKKFHTIRSGDTLGAIAQKNHTSVAKICKLNHLKPTSTLQLGRKLRVK